MRRAAGLSRVLGRPQEWKTNGPRGPIHENGAERVTDLSAPPREETSAGWKGLGRTLTLPQVAEKCWTVIESLTSGLPRMQRTRQPRRVL